MSPVMPYPLNWRTISALFAGALGLSLLFAPVAIRAAFSVGAVDRGGGRRVHAGAVPRLGGTGIFSSCLIVSAAAYFPAVSGRALYEGRVLGLALATALVFLVGVYDDIKGLRVYKKLFFEVLAGCILYRFGFRAEFLSSPFGAALDLSSLSLMLTVLWVIVVTNSINLIDGLDGVAAGTGIFVALTMLIVSNDPFTEAAAVILIGSLCGFLFFNYPPARLFMGDSGSLFIGFVLAALSMTAGGKSAAAFGIMVPMTAFAFPLMDMAYAVLRRYYRGLPLGNADREHIHHKLLEKGFSKRKVILVLCGINFFLMLLALMLVGMRHFPPLWYFMAVSAAAVGGLRYLNYVEFWPFVKAVIGNHVSARKRKYHRYLLRAFQRDIKKVGPGRADEVYGRIALLLADMDFASARIDPGAEGPQAGRYVWLNPVKKPSCHVSLSFPIERSGRVYGNVRLKRDIREDALPCVDELMYALSAVIYPILVEKPPYPKSRPVVADERRPAPLSINFN